ncbi:apolipoprotein N-acyltransferase (plasmid) [Alcanivorax sp. N3-2A]|nr:apolipoprotein N-acyltransferase [Alcanivorax sp. N3-2A]ASK36925.1 apolipoprotein N-acyltransferase [Alcanivorax sp. N3-2A]|tara:strand:- start:35932 stop:37410 length:1479 start_codon:yes stop_codon:yes gene_type:complete
MLKLLLPLIAGLLFPLAFAPYGLWPVLPVSIALGYASLLNAATPRRALLHGWLYGLGMFSFGVSWLHVSMTDYGAMPLWMSIPFTGLFAAFIALYYGLTFWLSRRWRLGALGFAGLWLIADWLRGWLFTGFPWLYSGYALIDTPLAGLAPLGGVWAVTLLAVVLSATVVELLRRRGHTSAPLVASVVLVMLALAGGQAGFTEAAGGKQKVALVQGNIPQDLKWLATMREQTQGIYAGLTDNLPAETLVIWPESAMIEFYQDIEGFVNGEGQRLAARGGALISGLPWRDQQRFPPTYHNSIAVIGADGASSVYHKQKLVPFGEYVPLQDLIRGWIPFFDLPMSSFTPGHPDQPNLHALGQEVSPFICYEILYPDLVARRTASANVLLTISNDAWFGRSAGPHQHFEMARMRALETGRWLLRATNNGITAVVDPHGKVVKQLPQFERDVLLGEYQPRQGRTPFMIAGVWPSLLAALAFVVLGRHKKPRNPIGDL